MKNGRCKVCYWDGSQSKLIQSKKYEAIIEPNFSINIDGTIVVFEYLVLGFGAKNGMLVDSRWENISPYSEKLLALGYGYSCFKLDIKDLVNFEEVLEDWGKSS
jgi:hypothetical protein